MKVGDLVMVDFSRNPARFVSVIVEVCLPEEQVNGMHLIKVLDPVGNQWYPVGYIEVICET